MGISWSNMRKNLENEYICESLKGRIQYFATRYHHSHDSEGRVSIRIDNKEVFKSCYFDWCNYCCKSDISAINNGAFDQFFFYKAYYIYDNQPIKDSLNSNNAIVRLFAILDKRTGKRTLEKIKNTVDIQPDWLKPFYELRLSAENINYIERI